MSVRLILVGPPGAGKGTQADLLCESLGIPPISTGAIFRSHASSGDELGKMAESFTSRGELVPDSVTNKMVAARLAQPDAAGGFLLDGYPRNLPQVAALDAILEDAGTHVDAVLSLIADDDEVVQRLLGRAASEGRVDDTEDVIRHRIELYHGQTEPLLAVYRERGILVEVPGMGTIEEVAANVQSELKAFLSK
ncbi:MAG: adenylate kinase [Ancrocorticia sp.]|uniref:adenylate kinase n=1 Tax=Ancrocorticia sp. TaxID=2593684 RepID=UPI003F937227